jgi:hypothetical protein
MLWCSGLQFSFPESFPAAKGMKKRRTHRKREVISHTQGRRGEERAKQGESLVNHALH